MPSNCKISIPKIFLSLRFLLIVIPVSCLVGYAGITSVHAQADSSAAVSTAATPPAGGAGQAAGIPTDDAAISQGATIFSNNCSVCHAIDAQIVGPALKNVTQRRPLPWIINFVHNSQKVIQSGDEYAVNLFNQFNKTVMTSFTDLTEDEIKSVMAYIQSESNKAAPAPAVAVGDKTSPEGDTESADTGVSSTYLNIILIGLVIVLVLILVVLLLMVTLLNRFVRQREDLDEADRAYIDQKLDWQKTFKSPAFIGIVAFIFLTIVVKVGIDGLYSIGQQQGYQPRQPIAFSHKLHAGQYEIACQYCHTGVMKAKNANIPSPNICMNCHSQIKTESPEIQKIYAAIDYNPKDQSYGTKTKPIEWVRIHNLPDLAYFNHSQHVKVAGLKCENCHGDIKEMEVVYQYSKLTMGWCINCHRETEVNYKGNGYYDKLIEIHNAEKKKGTPMYVSEIGGLECSKCHY